MESAPFAEDAEHHYAMGIPVGKKVLLKLPNGTIKGTFTTITEAIKSWQQGETVVISRGVYKESITIISRLHEGIHIEGESKEDTIVEGQNRDVQHPSGFREVWKGFKFDTLPCSKCDREAHGSNPLWKFDTGELHNLWAGRFCGGGRVSGWVSRKH